MIARLVRVVAPVFTCALILSPAPAFTQPAKIGVVIAVESGVTIMRAGDPPSLPLRFRDIVFAGDAIATPAGAIARVLLGRTALVTVAGGTVLSFPDTEGHTRIRLASGTVMVAMVADTVRAQEPIEIATPNAIARVRGTVVAEVRPGGPGRDVAKSAFHVVRGAVAAGAPVGQAGRSALVTATALQSVSVVGTAVRLEPIAPAEVTRLTSTLRRTILVNTPVVGPAKAQAVSATLALLGVLSGRAGGGRPSGARIATLQELSDAGKALDVTRVSAPITTLTGSPDVLARLRPAVDISGVSATLAQGQRILTLSSDLAWTSSAPLVRIAGSTLSQPGIDTLMRLEVGTTLDLAAPLLDVIDSTIDVANRLLAVEGRVTSHAATPLLRFDPSTVGVVSDVIRIVGPGTVTLAGPLFSDVGGQFALSRSGSVLDLISTDAQRAVLVGLGPGPLIDLTGTTMAVGGSGTPNAGYLTSIVTLRFQRGPAPPQLTLAGPLLAAMNSTIAVTGGRLLDNIGGTVTSTSAAPFTDLSGGALTFGSGAAPFTVSGGRMDITGPLFRATGTTLVGGPIAFLELLARDTFFDVLAPRGGFAPILAPSRVSLGGPLLHLVGTSLGGFSLLHVSPESRLSTSAGPLVRLESARLVETLLIRARFGSLLELVGLPGTPAGIASNRGLIELAGSLLQADRSTIVIGTVLDLSPDGHVRLTLAPAEPVFRLDGSVLTVFDGPLVRLGAGGLLFLGGTGTAMVATGTPSAPSVMNLAGSLLALDGPVNLVDPTAQVRLGNVNVIETRPSSLVTVSALGDATLAGALLLATDSQLTVGSRVLDVLGRLTAGAPVLGASNSAFVLPNGLVRVANGGALATTGSGPFASIVGGSIVAGDVAVSGTLFDLAGPPGATAVDAETGLTIGTHQPLRHPGGAWLEVTGGATVSVQGPSGSAYKVDTALVEASAPLLTLAGNAAFRTSGHAIDLSLRARVTSLGDALMKLDRSALNVANGHLVNIAGGSRLSVAGDVLHMTNGSSLNIGSGGSGLFLNVAGGSVASITGALVRFGGAGNAVTVNNSIAPTGTLPGFPTVPVSVPAGATLTVTGAAAPIVGLGASGSITVSGGGSFLAVGPGSVLRLGP